LTEDETFDYAVPELACPALRQAVPDLDEGQEPRSRRVEGQGRRRKTTIFVFHLLIFAAFVSFVVNTT
jgi:hypothetical protein